MPQIPPSNLIGGSFTHFKLSGDPDCTNGISDPTDTLLKCLDFTLPASFSFALNDGALYDTATNGTFSKLVNFTSSDPACGGPGISSRLAKVTSTIATTFSSATSTIATSSTAASSLTSKATTSAGSITTTAVGVSVVITTSAVLTPTSDIPTGYAAQNAYTATNIYGAPAGNNVYKGDAAGCVGIFAAFMTAVTFAL
ncbi:hypothetical protein HDU99_010576 [Rhizoclosmatium hyalinum]|nr:hypothetical protein HDU99_010576 [Rhizoclosmatium hyalinum]